MYSCAKIMKRVILIKVIKLYVYVAWNDGIAKFHVERCNYIWVSTIHMLRLFVSYFGYEASTA